MLREFFLRGYVHSVHINNIYLLKERIRNTIKSIKPYVLKQVLNEQEYCLGLCSHIKLHCTVILNRRFFLKFGEGFRILSCFVALLWSIKNCTMTFTLCTMSLCFIYPTDP